MATAQVKSLKQWREDASAAFGSLMITAPDPEEFCVNVKMVSIGEVTLYDITTPAHSVQRHATAAANAPEGFGKLSLQLEGECTVRQNGRSCTLHPGDLAFYVTQSPYELVYPTTQHSMVVYFPQRFVHMSSEDMAMVTATRISGVNGLGRVAVPLFEQLAMNFEILDGPHAGSLIRSALDMLVTVLSSELTPKPLGSTSNTLFRQATQYIDEHISDMDLRPGVIASALFVSVRHLHSQFAANGQSVSTYIRNRRLELIQRDLADPCYANDTIQIIGTRHGLPEASHVSRAFRAEYGESPSQYRSRVLFNPPAP